MKVETVPVYMPLPPGAGRVSGDRGGLGFEDSSQMLQPIQVRPSGIHRIEHCTIPLKTKSFEKRGSRDAHLLDELGQNCHLVDSLARRRLVHLHSNFCDLHGGSDDNLAGSGHTASKTLESKVSVWIHLRIINLKIYLSQLVLPIRDKKDLEPGIVAGRSHSLPT